MFSNSAALEALRSARAVPTTRNPHTAYPSHQKGSAPHCQQHPPPPLMSPDVKPATATTRRKSPSGPRYSKPTESSTARLAAKVVRKASAATRPLLPLSEGKLYQDRAESRGHSRETETEKWHVNLDNAAAARDGRQFTVANVGNNGRIYLRYRNLISPPLLEPLPV